MDTNKTSIITASKKTPTKLNNVQFKIYHPTISCISANKVQQFSVGTPSPKQLQSVQNFVVLLNGFLLHFADTQGARVLALEAATALHYTIG
jgi:hypothetical protein